MKDLETCEELGAFIWKSGYRIVQETHTAWELQKYKFGGWVSCFSLIEAENETQARAEAVKQILTEGE